MQQYKQLVRDVLENGTEREDRTGVGTLDFEVDDLYTYYQISKWRLSSCIIKI